MHPKQGYLKNNQEGAKDESDVWERMGFKEKVL
jgi:hypothetical protein